jgi:hypothetical protein
MDKGCLVNFRVSEKERDELKAEAKTKKLRGLSSFLRFVVRKYAKQTEPNKDGLYDG